LDLSRKRRRELWLAGAALVLLALFAVDVRRIVQLDAWNRALADGSAAALQGDLPAPLVFAQGYQARPGGEYQQVLALYKRAELAGDATLRSAARYNSGNVYFREGLAMRERETEQQAVPLLELAKASYRQVLREDPGNWQARYNLERVLRQSPEAEQEDGGGEAPLQSERAVTTMRGFTLGLP
jgi:mxaK protein